MTLPLIAIIGSEGLLGRVLVRALAGRYEIRRVDLNVPNEPGVLRADVRAQEDMERAVAGAAVAVHLAAYHGGCNPPPTDETRFEVNVTGTFRMLQACLKHGVRRVAWASSTGATSKAGLYATTKVIGEDLCDYYHLTHGFQVVMPRYGAFTPCDLLTYGERMLTCGVDIRDCVAATARAVDRLAEGAALHGAVTVMPDHGLSAAQCENFGRDWRDILGASDPDFPGLVARFGLAIPERLPRHDLAPIVDVLGLKPEHNLFTFLRELKEQARAGRFQVNPPRWCQELGTPPPPGVVWSAAFAR